MFSKKLLFALGTIFFIVSMIGLFVFKVENISVNISESSIQSKMEPIYYFKKTLSDVNVSYEIMDPTVSVLDNGDVTIKSELTLMSGADTKWGIAQFTSKVSFDHKNNAFYLKIPDQIQLKVSGKDSHKENFNLWRTDAKTLASIITPQINAFLKKTAIETLKDSQLRNQASSLTIESATKQQDNIHLQLAVDQGVTIVIIYTVIFLSVFTWACAFFFVGGTIGFKDAEGIGFRDPRRDPNND